MRREYLDDDRVRVALLESGPGEERVGVPGEGDLVPLFWVVG